MENKVARAHDFERWGLSERCLGCRYLRTGQGRQKAHSMSCRRRIEALLGGDLSGSARLAVADERINHALADAVERQATKDLGTTGILTRASVVCHPESHPQVEIALSPHTPVTCGGASGSGVQPSDTTSTGTDDMTREKKDWNEHRTSLEQAATMTLAMMLQ